MFAGPSPTMATPAYRPTTSLGTNFADLDVASTPLGIGYIVLTNRARHPAWKLGGIMRIGLVGYGVGGRYFHAPFIQAAEGCELTGIVARSPQRVAEVHQDLPGVPVFASLGELLDAGVDAVTISTPPQTRRELVLEAVGRGVNVIADKPFAPTAAAGQALVDAAAAAGVLLSVFHNRRWDTDIATLRGVLTRASGRGLAIRLSIRSRRAAGPWRPGPDGELLRDLAAISSTERCGFSDRRNWCRRTSTGWSCPKGAPTQASSSRSRTPAGHTPTSRRAR